MSIDILFQILSTAATGIGTSAAIASFFAFTRKKKIQQEEDLSVKIERASKHLVTASEDLSNLQEELSSRIKIVNQLKEEARIAEDIVSLNKGQVEAIRTALNIELKKDSKRNFWTSFSIGFLFFVLGAIASYIISKFF